MIELKAKEGCCEEASPSSFNFYIPCNKPAVSMVGYKNRKEGPYRMCEACTYHNVNNRSGMIVGPYPPTS